MSREILIVVILLLIAEESSQICRRKRQSGDLSSTQLRQLLNSRVVNQQEVRRPLGNLPQVGPLHHAGMVVELDQPVGGTTRWLVHKGPNYGGASDTVATRADHMSSRWSTHSNRQPINGQRRVSDYIQSGGQDYSLLRNNCQHAVGRWRSGSGRTGSRRTGSRRIGSRIRNWFRRRG